MTEMTTLADHRDAFLADLQRETRPTTLRADRADLTLAARSLTQPLDHVPWPTVEQVLRGGAPSPATVTRRTVSLRRCFTWAMQQGVCAANPLAQRAQRPRARRRACPMRSTTDLATVDAVIGAMPPPDRLIFTLVRETGMRIGAVLALNYADVTLAPGQEGLHMRDPKHGGERIAILGPDSTPKRLRGVRAWVRQFPGQPGWMPLFRSNRGTRVSYAAVQYQWAQRCAQAGLVETDGHLRSTMHQLRHTRGSELVRQRQRMEIIQRGLGHRDIRSTQNYADLDDVQVREALEQGAQQR